MKTKNIFFTLALSLFMFVGFNSFAEVKTQDRSISGGFTKVNVSTAINLHLSQGSGASVKVEADDEVIDYIVTKVDKGTLIVKFDGSSRTDKNKSTGRMTVYVTVPSLEEITASSACSISLDTPFSLNNDFELNLSGACSMSKANITAKKIDFDLSGASSVKDCTVAADKLDIDASGASNCSVNVKVVDLSVEASGASSIKLSGLAKKVEAEASGASSIKAQDFTYENSNVKSTSASTIKLSK